MLIDSAGSSLDWRQYCDDTPEKLAALVEAKVAGREVVAPTEEPVQVLKLLDALKQSVATACSEQAAAVVGKSSKTIPERRSA
jgi:non-homologous end joining protein Ku